MDTVTESQMAIAMAQVRITAHVLLSILHILCFCVLLVSLGSMQLGGMGFLHYNCSVAEQVQMLVAVKSHIPGCTPSVSVVAPELSFTDFKAQVCLICPLHLWADTQSRTAQISLPVCAKGLSAADDS